MLCHETKQVEHLDRLAEFFDARLLLIMHIQTPEKIFLNPNQFSRVPKMGISSSYFK